MSERQFRRHQAFGDEPLWPVKIREQRLQSARALRHAAFNLAPLILRDDKRQRIERPRTVRSLRIGVDVVGDAVLDDQPPRQLERAPRDLRRLVGAQAFDEPAPMRAHRPVLIQKLIIAAAVRIIAPKRRIACGAGGKRAWLAQRFVRHVRRRSSVKGRSGLERAGSRQYTPGVCPVRKKRARRRLSDSKAFTGKLV